ncbi:MAG: Maf family protein [Dehalobacterium sp.]
MKKKIILASASPRRLELMQQIGIIPEIITGNVNEEWDGRLSGRELARQLALKKAQACANKVREGIIISADTVVVLEDRIYGKPKDFNQAMEMLCSLSGKKHSVITGIAVLECPEGKVMVDYEETHVIFKTLTDNEIRSYIDWGESWDKAGGYGIQGKGALLVERIEGDYYNVVGLPLQKLNNLLMDFNINLLMEEIFQE